MRHNIIQIFSGLLVLFISSCGYLKVNPPPDANHGNKNEKQYVWLAAAANLLAAAGYGQAKSTDEKSEEIYNQLIGEFGNQKTGWTDTAIQWWLDSGFNIWPENPYTLTTVMGYKRDKIPYNHDGGTQQISQLLRVFPVKQDHLLYLVIYAWQAHYQNAIQGC